jgi:RNA polymerase sigma factor (sigma-70 family)
MKAREIFEANINQQVSRWHPETQTYRGADNKIPQSDTVDPDDVTARHRRVDRFTNQDAAWNTDIDNSISGTDTKIDREKLIPLVKAAMKDLEPMEKEVLNYRFWHNLTLEQTGEKLGLSKQRIRQIEAQALRKLKHPRRGDSLRNAMGLSPA